MTPTQWQPIRSATPNAQPHAFMGIAIGRGLLGHCSACGKSHLFNGFLRVVAECCHCSARLGLVRADDAPPCFTILLTGQLIIPLLFLLDRMNEPPLWLMTAISMPLTLGLPVGLLRPIKGGTMGLMLNLNMLKSVVADR